MFAWYDRRRHSSLCDDYKMTVLCYLQVLPEYQAQVSQQTQGKEPKSAISRIFSRYDVVETSYHFLCQRIDLHLCDDPGGEGQLLQPMFLLTKRNITFMVVFFFFAHCI